MSVSYTHLEVYKRQRRHSTGSRVHIYTLQGGRGDAPAPLWMETAGRQRFHVTGNKRITGGTGKMRIIAVMSPKGGIGKTTTSDAIAYMLGEDVYKRQIMLFIKIILVFCSVHDITLHQIKLIASSLVGSSMWV